MTIFWILVAALTLLALTLVLPGLIKRRPVADSVNAASARLSTIAILRDQKAQLDAELAAGTLDAEQHRVGREEIERRVLDETDGTSGSLDSAASSAQATAPRAWKTALLLALGMPLLAIGIYGRLGAPQALDTPPAEVATGGTGEVTPEQVEKLVKTLAERMEAMPDDVQGWTLLARTYATMQRFPEADKAYARATVLAPQNAQLLIDHADVRAMLQGQRLAGEPARMIARALELDPKNVKGLALAGGMAYEAGDNAQAIHYWKLARELTPPGSEFADNLTKGIEQAQAATASSAPVAASADASASTGSSAAAPSANAGAAARVAGQVSLSPALASKAAPTDTVFIFARAAEGPRMPLAIVRRTVADLPITFTLDDTMAMSPEMKLSKFPVVVVGARVSRSGNAMPSPGDLSGQLNSVTTGTEGLQIVIDTVQP
ncbi:MAG: c-type cytochrome biogenesis protein CcmI [Burkholderiaceae bacterium]|nr:c-type cytochrome biogenesis protein CcmI [Burkholderiaceae bacterium]